MNVSILIPTYRYDCRKLVRELLPLLPDDGEIVVGDDCSDDAETALYNKEIASWPRCRLFEAPRNMGRAAIRNALAERARGEWLLFIDADAEVRSADFLSRYAEASLTADVVCGGTGNMPSCPRPGALLRYRYEIAGERRLTLAFRRAHPYAHFTTFNFLIRRQLFLSVRFDEACREYGHEDTLFGMELGKRGIAICHIDNKLTHLGLEDAADYLRKTEVGLRSLSGMSPEMQRHARISSLTLRLQRFHVIPYIVLFHRLFSPLERRNLLGSNPSLKVFALYKLGYYVSLP